MAVNTYTGDIEQDHTSWSGLDVVKGEAHVLKDEFDDYIMHLKKKVEFGYECELRGRGDDD